MQSGPSAQDVEREGILDGLWQLLDDMGPEGLSVCQAAKDQAMGAYRASLPDELKIDWPSAFDTLK